MIARRRLNGLDCIMFRSFQPSVTRSSSLREKLIEKLFEHVVAHDAGIGVGLALAMKDSRGRLVDSIGLAKREVFVDGGVERAALHKRSNLGHFRGRENGGDGAGYIARLLPLLLIYEESLFHGLNLAELCGGARVAGGNPPVGRPG